ncbi:MAG: META domain-containing protein [Pseudomonadota bacterium]
MRWSFAVFLIVSMAASSVAARTFEATLQSLNFADPATVLVEVVDGGGTVAATERLSLDPSLSPAGFQLELPGTYAVDLRVGVYMRGQLTLINFGIEVPAGDADVSQQNLPLYPFEHLLFALDYQCGDVPVRLQTSGTDAIALIGVQSVALAQVESASGAKYADADDAGTFVWTKGLEAQVSFEGMALDACVATLPPASPTLRAFGNEPFWSMTASGRTAEFVPNIGEDPIVFSFGDVALTGLSRTYRDTERGATLIVAEEICRDTMAGMPFPNRIEVTFSDVRYQGCGGASVELLARSEWTIERVGSEALPPDIDARMVFSRNGRISGSSGCNTFSGPFEVTGEGMEIGNTIVTQRACPPALMTLERNLLRGLGEVSFFDFLEDGALGLFGYESPSAVIVARPSP